MNFPKHYTGKVKLYHKDDWFTVWVEQEAKGFQGKVIFEDVPVYWQGSTTPREV